MFALIGSSSDSLGAKVFVEDGWLKVHSVPMMGLKGHPFRAQVALADLVEIAIREPVQGAGWPGSW